MYNTRSSHPGLLQTPLKATRTTSTHLLVEYCVSIRRIPTSKILTCPQQLGDMLQNGKLLCYRLSPVDGDLSSLNSFCARIEAICSLLYWLRLLFKLFPCTRPRDCLVVIWIDNSSALKYSKLDDFFKPNQHIGNESDIINDIFAIKT
jgi:hypothetical protein